MPAIAAALDLSSDDIGQLFVWVAVPRGEICTLPPALRNTHYGGELTGQSSQEPAHPSLHLAIASSRLVHHKTKASPSEFVQRVQSVALPPSKVRALEPAPLPQRRGSSTVAM